MKLAQEYKKQWLFFKKDLSKTFIILFIVFFAISILLHFATAQLLRMYPDTANQIMKMLNEMMKGFSLEEAPIVLGIKLFFNNARATLIMVSVGVIPFLFLPLLLMGYNALLVGVVTGFSDYLGMSMVAVFAGLVPHGIFEFPAIILASTLGFYLCKETVKTILKKNDRPFGEAALMTIKSYVLVLIPLLIIAALVEGLITPLVMAMFM